MPNRTERRGMDEWLDELRYLQPVIRSLIPEKGLRNCYYAAAVARRLARRYRIDTSITHVQVSLEPTDGRRPPIDVSAGT